MGYLSASARYHRLMAINIKNPRVCALIKEAAARTGRPQTSVLEEALESYLRQVEGGAPRDGVDETLARIDALLTDADRRTMRAEMDGLYDDQGLPA